MKNHILFNFISIVYINQLLGGIKNCYSHFLKQNTVKLMIIMN